MEDEIELVDSENDQEIEGESAEDKAARLEEANRKLFARLKKEQGFVQDSSGKWVKKEAPKPPEEKPTSDRQEAPKPSDILKADEFKLYRQGYTESEIDFIMHNGGMKALEDEKSPLAMGLKVAREQRNAEEASGQVSDKSGLSEIERKYTPEQMRKMTPAQLEELIGFAPEQ